MTSCNSSQVIIAAHNCHISFQPDFFGEPKYYGMGDGEPSIIEIKFYANPNPFEAKFEIEEQEKKFQLSDISDGERKGEYKCNNYVLQ